MDHAVSTPKLAGNSLREVVLRAALKILDRDGLHLAPDSISYARVFAYLEETYGIKVTRGSVHERIWASHDEFRRDVLVQLIATSSPSDFFIGDGAGFRLMQELLDTEAVLDTKTAEELDRIRTLVSKLMSRQVAKALLESEVYRQVQSTKALATRFNDPETALAVQSVLREQVRSRLDARREILRLVTRAVGMRVKPSLGLNLDEASDLMFLVCWALMSGTFVNAGAGCTAVLDEVPGDLGLEADGSPWSIFDVGIRSIVEFLFEADPDQGISPALVESFPERMMTNPGEEADALAAPAPLPDKSARRSRGELKQLVLRGGAETLRRDGMNLRPESLSYAAVFAQVFADEGLVVNRASVHKRFWSSHLEFCLEVMGLGLEAEANVDPRYVDAAYAVPVIRNADGTVDKVLTAHDTLQAVSQAILRPLLDSPVMRRRMLIKTAVNGQVDLSANHALRKLVVESELAAVAEETQLIQDTVLDLGFEVRPELGLDDKTALETMAILLRIFSVGASFEHLAGATPERTTFALPRQDGTGDVEAWLPGAIFSRAVFELLYQPIAD